MRKLRLDRKGLSDMVATVVLLTLVMVLGAVIAGTLSGAPRPVMPAVTALNLTNPHGGNPRAGDDVLVIRHEYGMPIADAWLTDDENKYQAGAMRLLINGAEIHPLVTHAAAGGAPVDLPRESAQDFAIGDQIRIVLDEPLRSSDLFQIVFVPRNLMLVEYLVQ